MIVCLLCSDWALARVTGARISVKVATERDTLLIFLSFECGTVDCVEMTVSMSNALVSTASTLSSLRRSRIRKVLVIYNVLSAYKAAGPLKTG